jgi:RNA polymerase-binding transcription factor DksA
VDAWAWNAPQKEQPPQAPVDLRTGSAAHPQNCHYLAQNEALRGGKMSTASNTCFICDKIIETDRLEKVPNTLFCADHARKRSCQRCDKEIEAGRITSFPETLYCAAHVVNDRACQICDQLIEYWRREAVPESSLCQAHAEAAKKHGGEFKREVMQLKLGKPGISGGKGSDIETARSINREAIAKAREEYLKSRGYTDL